MYPDHIIRIFNIRWSRYQQDMHNPGKREEAFKSIPQPSYIPIVIFIKSFFMKIIPNLIDFLFSRGQPTPCLKSFYTFKTHHQRLEEYCLRVRWGRRSFSTLYLNLRTLTQRAWESVTELQATFNMKALFIVLES